MKFNLFKKIRFINIYVGVFFFFVLFNYKLIDGDREKIIEEI